MLKINQFEGGKSNGNPKTHPSSGYSSGACSHDWPASTYFTRSKIGPALSDQGLTSLKVGAGYAFASGEISRIFCSKNWLS